MKRVLVVLLLALAATGCQTIKNIFNDVKKENIEPPTPLTEIVPAVQVQLLWQERIGKGSDKSGVRISPAVVDGKLYAAGTDGTISALDAATGKTLWSKHLGKRHGFIWHHGNNTVRWAGGPGTDGKVLAVGSLEGAVQAFDAATGDERWNAQLSSEVIAAPVIVDGIVVVRTNDGRLYGLDANDGSRKWTYDRSTVPILSLRGNAPPEVAGGLVYSGGDNGKLAAITLNEGKTAWEQTISTGEGRTEIERIQDVDGPISVVDGVVYASGYHGQVAALVAQTGRPLWTHVVSSYTGVSVAPTQIYVVDTDSVVWALDLRTGASNWKQDALKYRWLSPAISVGDYAVVGDFDGFVHVLDGSDGKIVGRTRLSKHEIQAAPVVVNDTVYIEDIDGAVGAWRISK
ncbi:MAG TPA: outer membrane protein assembly factor BamB [Rudaea sp.]|jgi:outer membrane protein assembly factor BamB|nr:outer membrane protein assembly factor BamB [Rudaea sp.]